MCPVIDMANHKPIGDQLEFGIVPESYEAAFETLDQEKEKLTNQCEKAIQKQNGYYQ